MSTQADSGLAIELRQSKYLNNIVEQDHRAIKRIVHRAADDGVQVLRLRAHPDRRHRDDAHMIRKGQLDAIKDRASSAANQFYSLVFRSPSA